MNEYGFYIELNDGTIIERVVFAATRSIAHDELDGYLSQCGIDGSEIRVIVMTINDVSGDDEDDALIVMTINESGDDEGDCFSQH